MKTNQREKILIVLTIVAVSLLAGDKLIYSPLSRLWQSRQQEIKRLHTQVSEGRALSKREQVLRSRWEEMRTNTLPNNASMTQEQVLKALQEWAQESGASLNAVTPQWKNQSEEYKTLVCRVDASGTPWMLTRFLFNIEKAPMGLKVESVDLSARDNTGQQLALGLQLSGLVLTSSPQ